MHDYFDLSDKRVLEVGCFEGVHTIGLGDFAREVCAVDARMENVVKTIVRCAIYGRHPSVFMYDLETQTPDVKRLEADLVHHVGVLYHLKNPVAHLLSIGSYIRTGIMLDSHYCYPDQADSTYEHDGRHYRYMRYRESGRQDPFSGVHDHAKWLLLEDIIGLLAQSGFIDCLIVETRQEQNGPRVLLFARRSNV
jgi:tRNA (mo5U34)-methyltransferase